MTDLVKKLQVVKAFNRSESSFHSITETKKDDSYETVYFHGKPILCTKRSLYLIPVRNKFRMTMLWIQEWKWFDRFILFLIALNSLFLALQDFSFRLDESNKNWRNTIVEESEIYFLGFFTLEASIKILGKGFIIGTGTYLKDAWNILDFLVVVIGWLGFIPGMANVSALRTIRVLRPLKSVKQIRSLRKMVMSLFRSLPDLANVAIFLLFIFIVFGIIGVALLQGNLYQRCRYTDEPDGDSWEADPDITQLCALDQTGLYSCPDDRYCGLPGSEGLFEYDFYREAQIPELDFGIPNFDNLASACLTIFQISTLEGWNNMMYAYYDSYSPTLLSIYFSIMVLCISFFILNLMLAVSWSSFKVIKDEDNVAYPRFANTDESLQNEDLDSVRLREEIKKVEEFRRLDSIGDRATGVRPKETEHSVGFIASEQHDALKETEKEKKKITFAISDKGNTEQTTGDPFQTYKTICTDANTPKRIVGFRETQGQEELSPECWPDDNSPNKTAQESTKIAPSNAVTGLMRKETLKRRVTRKLATIDNDSLRWKLIGIVNSQNWGYAINICIIINTIFLALDRYPMPEEEQRVYEIANIIFFSIFLIEMILKLLALHPQAYCLDSFNVFDGFIVILSCIEVVLFYSGIVGDGGSAISAFRAFRLLRIFKLAKKWPEVRKLMNTIFLCLKDVSYFSVLLLLFMFIYTLIGMEIYAYKLRFSGDDVDLQDGTSPRNNFDNFLHAFVSVYAALVGDDWQYMMYDAIRWQGYFSAVLYFVSLLMIGNVILLNLFLAILFGNFENEEEPIQKEKEKQDNQRSQGTSLFIFGPNNFFRILLGRIVTTEYFDHVITIIIIISSITLALDNPLNDPESGLTITLEWIDMIVSIIFIVEAGLKIIVRGFLWAGKDSYLRDGWNILDFILVLFSLLSLSTSVAALSKLKAFRTFRVLKPLRVLSKNQHLKLAINSFLKSLPNMANVLIVSLFFMLLFGIVCVNYLKGAFYHCNLDQVVDIMPSQIKDQHDWLNAGGVWINKDANFDNAGNAILTLFIASSTEGWQEIMYSATDAVGIGKQPQLENQIGWIFFFIFFVSFGCFFMLNILVGVVIDKFDNQKQKSQGLLFLTEEQKNYAMIKAYMLNYRPIVIKHPPENTIRRQWFFISENSKFEAFIMTCIVLNAVVLALNYYGEPEMYAAVIDRLNLIFTIIFTMEACIKITAYKWDYFDSSSNLFDFTIVTISVIELVITIFVSVPGLNIVTLFRIFRIGRVLRLVKSAKQLRVIFSTFILALPQVTNIGALLLLFMYIYTILGVQLFAKVRSEGAMNEYANFQEFWKAFMLLIRSATGEAWNELMFAAAKQPGPDYDCIDNPTYEQIQDNGGEPNGCGSMWAYFYFISFLLLVALVFLNLFIAVILQEFARSEALENGRLTGQSFENFRQHWSKYDPKGTGHISIERFGKFLATLDPPLGHRDCDRAYTKKLLRHIKQRKMKVYADNTYHFYQVSNALASVNYKEDDTKIQPETDDICFAQMEKRASKIFPALKTPTMYTSKHIFFIQRLQAIRKAVILKNQSREIKYEVEGPVTSLKDTDDPENTVKHLTSANSYPKLPPGKSQKDGPMSSLTESHTGSWMSTMKDTDPENTVKQLNPGNSYPNLPPLKSQKDQNPMSSLQESHTGSQIKDSNAEFSIRKSYHENESLFDMVEHDSKDIRSMKISE